MLLNQFKFDQQAVDNGLVSTFTLLPLRTKEFFSRSVRISFPVVWNFRIFATKLKSLLEKEVQVFFKRTQQLQLKDSKNYKINFWCLEYSWEKTWFNLKICVRRAKLSWIFTVINFLKWLVLKIFISIFFCILLILFKLRMCFCFEWSVFYCWRKFDYWKKLPIQKKIWKNREDNRLNGKSEQNIWPHWFLIRSKSIW